MKKKDNILSQKNIFLLNKNLNISQGYALLVRLLLMKTSSGDEILDILV
jgi:hypothetical protein